MTKENIERIFRTSNSREELFDAFMEAIRNKCRDIELYKILIANPALDLHEITMFTDKIAREFPEERYNLYLWVAELFSNASFNLDYYEKALEYFILVFEMDTDNYSPLINALNLYNYDLDVELNKEIIAIVEGGAELVKEKCKMYYALANHFKKVNDDSHFRKYSSLANKAAQNKC